jgi:hypothetical protein
VSAALCKREKADGRKDPGTFASTASDEDALGGVCYKAQEYSKFAVPVVVTECEPVAA